MSIIDNILKCLKVLHCRIYLQFTKHNDDSIRHENAM